MPTFRPTPDLDMHYEVDDFTARGVGPGRHLDAARQRRERAGVVRLGPGLARQYKVVRPDMRGFGASTPMARDFRGRLPTHHRRFRPTHRRPGRQPLPHLGAPRSAGRWHGLSPRDARAVDLTVVGTPPPLRAGAAERVTRTERGLRTRRMGPGRVKQWAAGSAAISARRRRVVDPLHGPHSGFDPDRLYANHRLRRRPPSENTLPHPRYHDRRQRARLG